MQDPKNSWVSLDPVGLAKDLGDALAAMVKEMDDLAHVLTSEDMRRRLERIAGCASPIDRIVADLLDLAGADAGSFPLRPQNAGLADIVTDAIRWSLPAAQRARVVAEIRDTPTVHVDRGRLERAFANMLYHAGQAGHPSSPVVVSVDTRHYLARVSIRDSGPGLTTEQAATLFARQRTPCTHACVGMGLYVARRIIEAHGGRVGLESTPGKGSQITIELPGRRWLE